MNILFKTALEFEPKSKFQAGEGLDIGAFPFYTSSSKQKKFIDTKIYDGEAIILGTGGVPSVHFESNGFATSTDCLVAKLKKNAPFNTKFVYYYLLGNIHVLAKGFKGAGLKHISKAYIESIEIPVISIEEQNQYVSYFDDIQLLIKKRISMIALLDEYIKSQFFYIFGQDYHNEERWTWYPLKEMITEILSGWSPICENFPRKVESEWAVLKQGAVTRGEFFASENKSFPGEHDQAKLVTANKNDVLFSRKNTKDLVGSSVFVYDDFDKLLLPDTIFKLVYLPEKISGIYLVYLFNDYNFRKKLKKLASGSASSMVNISQAKLMALAIPVPKDFDLMQSFHYIATLVHDQKERLRKSLSLLEELFQTIVYEAFNPKLRTDNDEIESLMADEIELELFLNSLTSGNFENEEIYKMEADKLYQILEKTIKGNETDPSFRKGIIQRLDNGNIMIELNKEFKNRIIDEASPT